MGHGFGGWHHLRDRVSLEAGRWRLTVGIWRAPCPSEATNGLIARWIGTNTDIEDQKAATEALASLNAGLEEEVAARTADRDRVWRNSQDLLVVADAAGIFRAVSPSVTKILGWDPEELVGRSIFDFVLPDDQQATGQALTEAVRGTLDTYENRYRHKDGGFRWLSWVAAPEQGFVYASARNITAEKAAAEALEKAQEALRQSQKMEAVGQLTGGIAHDFNNMLAVVIGSLDLMRRRMGTQEPNLHRYLDAATEGARRAALLTQRLLAFSRQQPLNPQTTDINKRGVGNVGSAATLAGHGHPPRDGSRRWAMANARRSKSTRERHPEPCRQRARCDAGWRPADDRDAERSS